MSWNNVYVCHTVQKYVLFFFYAMVYTVIYLIKLIIKCMTDTKLEKSHLVIKWACNMRHFFSYAVL